MKVFQGQFTQQEPISDAAIDAAVAVLKSGRIHRYNTLDGELGEVAQLEAEYAAWQGTQFCLAVTSGGQAMQIAMRALGVQHGDVVLTNAFTLAPVPGAIEAVGGVARYVEIDENLRLDLDDLAQKAADSNAKFLLLSHMRGHLCDMDALMQICDQHDITVIEDCAHTMGAKWNATRSGSFGRVGCFSTQTYKHLNSGEGGFLCTDDPEVIAKATILSGSYMLYGRHGAGPDASAYDELKYLTPNCSARMDALRAAILRPQLANIEDSIQRWNERYDTLAQVLANHSAVALPVRPPQESMVGSSLQFRVPEFSASQCEALLAQAAKQGVELKWFGRAEPVGFTSNHTSWRYMPAQTLPTTDRLLSTLFDLRLPLTFSLDDCRLIGEVILEALETVDAA